jgi:hypothetical protein
MGVVASFLRKRATAAMVFSRLMPDLSARCPASWIATPSAMGSEKGMPSSITSAPAAGRPAKMASKVASSGSPAMMKVTSAGRLSPFNASNRSSIRVAPMAYPYPLI